MMQLGRGVGRANRRRLYRVQAVHTPAFVRRKPKQIKGMCGHVTARRAGSQAGVPSDRSSSLGWKTGVPSDRSSSLGWKTGVPSDRSSSLGWKTGVPSDRSSSLGWKAGVAQRGGDGASPARWRAGGHAISRLRGLTWWKSLHSCDRGGVFR